MTCIRCERSSGYVSEATAHMTVEECNATLQALAGRDCYEPLAHHGYEEAKRVKAVSGAMLSVEDVVLVVKGEVIADMIHGTVPWTCASFSELHDYVDANTYGLFCDEPHIYEPMTHEGWPGDQAFSDFVNAVQDEVDQWLQERTT